ncbi:MULTISPECIES: sigma-70 family RNA polymerase sigma factor [Kribbella]|jgi:RNA polymerase sigma-B factor|uniref:SigB/SigF/SigG family RNA polymerase sigma factor n=1 Tax=Kribbella karoonensis TaxID=324851 RepID=A0ABP4Q0A9_9ACTN
MSRGPVALSQSRADESARLERLLRSAHAARGRQREELLDQAIAAGLPLARTLARRYRGRGVDDEDLEQIACEHLIIAVRNYRPSDGSDFRSYAVPTIRGGIRHHFRDRAWAIRLPRRLQEIQTRVNAAQTALVVELGHWPSHREIAEALGVEVAEVVEAEQARGCFQPDSLDAPRPADGSVVSIGRTLADPGDTFELVDQVSSLRLVVEKLPDRDQLILRRRFVDHCTQAEIGAEIGVSQMQVSRRLRAILNQLQLALSPWTTDTSERAG